VRKRHDQAAQRIPKSPDPGFVGGYNWPAMFVGLLLLLLVNIAATQFVAYRLEYQPALGIPLLRYQLHSIYHPFAWAPWLLRYGSSADARIRLPLLSGALIVVAGAALAVILVYGMNLRRAKRLSRTLRICTDRPDGRPRWTSRLLAYLMRNRASMWAAGAQGGPTDFTTSA